VIEAIHGHGFLTPLQLADELTAQTSAFTEASLGEAPVLAKVAKTITESIADMLDGTLRHWGTSVNVVSNGSTVARNDNCTDSHGWRLWRQIPQGAMGPKSYVGGVQLRCSATLGDGQLVRSAHLKALTPADLERELPAHGIIAASVGELHATNGAACCRSRGLFEQRAPLGDAGN